MRSTYFLNVFAFVFVLAALAAGQDSLPASTESLQRARISLGSLNETAVSLPEPIYPSLKNRPKYPGIIFVKVEIDLREGRVVNAKAITGFPGFRKHAEDAALKAEFQPKKMEGPPLIAEGTLTYRYPAGKKRTKGTAPLKGLPVIVSGIVNGRAIELPKPFVPNYKGDGTVKVRIVVDMNGKVIDAWAVSGPTGLAQASESAARLAKFSPITYCCGSPIYTVAYLGYRFGIASRPR
jgi:hypothetical protein